jgi:hypothetical protein
MTDETRTLVTKLVRKTHEHSSAVMIAWYVLGLTSKETAQEQHEIKMLVTQLRAPGGVLPR